MDFDKIWATFVVPLSGKTVLTFSGKKNEILSVNLEGIMRITSESPEPSLMRIELFRWAVDKLLKSGRVTRTEIHSEFETDRCSSGVFAVLSQVPFFEIEPNVPATLTYKDPDR